MRSQQETATPLQDRLQQYKRVSATARPLEDRLHQYQDGILFGKTNATTCFETRGSSESIRSLSSSLFLSSDGISHVNVTVPWGDDHTCEKTITVQDSVQLNTLQYNSTVYRCLNTHLMPGLELHHQDMGCRNHCRLEKGQERVVHRPDIVDLVDVFGTRLSLDFFVLGATKILLSVHGEIDNVVAVIVTLDKFSFCTERHVAKTLGHGQIDAVDSHHQHLQGMTPGSHRDYVIL
jgi:hypothetical protein